MAVVINGSGTVTGLAVGGLPDGTVDEGTLATDSVTAAKIPASLENTFVSGRKNLIINGGFDVWQRGTSFSESDNYSADRWTDENSGASITITQQSFTLGQTDVSNNPKYYLRWAVTTGNDNSRITQKIENVSTFAGETVTLSYWAKHSSGTLPTGIKTALRQNFGSGGSPSSAVYTYGSTITLTSSWQKFTQTFTVPSINGKTLGTNNNNSLDVSLGWQDGTETAAYTIDFANVQLEKGSTATDFEHRSYGEELALCQRYFVKFPDGAGYFAGNAVGSNRVDTGFPLSVPLRTAPSVESNGYLTHRSGNANSSANAITLDPYNGLSSFLRLRCGGHSVTDEVAYVISISSEDLNLDAEL